MSFKDFDIANKKGSFGEQAVREFLESKGYIVYRPATTDKPHAFDMLAVRDKKEIIIAEVKTKPHRNYYLDTGIDLRHYNEYKNISEKYKFDIFLFFVDEMEEKIYGNFLSELKKTTQIFYKNKNRIIIYPLIEKGICYFPLRNMLFIAKLDKNKADTIKQFSRRKYDYLNKTDDLFAK